MQREVVGFTIAGQKSALEARLFEKRPRQAGRVSIVEYGVMLRFVRYEEGRQGSKYFSLSPVECFELGSAIRNVLKTGEEATLIHTVGEGDSKLVKRLRVTRFKDGGGVILTLSVGKDVTVSVGLAGPTVQYFCRSIEDLALKANKYIVITTGPDEERPTFARAGAEEKTVSDPDASDSASDASNGTSETYNDTPESSENVPENVIIEEEEEEFPF